MSDGGYHKDEIRDELQAIADVLLREHPPGSPLHYWVLGFVSFYAPLSHLTRGGATDRMSEGPTTCFGRKTTSCVARGSSSQPLCSS